MCIFKFVLLLAIVLCLTFFPFEPPFCRFMVFEYNVLNHGGNARALICIYFGKWLCLNFLTSGTHLCLCCISRIDNCSCAMLFIVSFYVLDIDECKEGSAGCSQICNNAIGNYSCSCSRGYELDNDLHRCNGNTLLLSNTDKFWLEILSDHSLTASKKLTKDSVY